MKAMPPVNFLLLPLSSLRKTACHHQGSVPLAAARRQDFGFPKTLVFIRAVRVWFGVQLRIPGDRSVCFAVLCMSIL
jgi:hypothetical protein